MKIKLLLICFGIALYSCKDQKKTESTSDPNESTESYERADQEEMDHSTGNSSTGNTSGENEISADSPSASAMISGVYIKDNHTEDSNCNCYCIDVTTTGNAELCLKEGALYINSRFSKNGNDINIYYAGKSSKTTDADIPWDQFETGTPIAVISPNKNGFKLDWKGFSINGDLAMDYAILGKKTLEGTYKRK